MKQFTEMKDKLDDEAVVKLGKKDPDAYPYYTLRTLKILY